MKLKEFLKPTKKKIIITFLTSILIFLFMPIMSDFVFVDFGSGGGPRFSNLFSEMMKQISGQYNIFYDKTTFRNFISWSFSQALIFINIVISIIFSYLISCFLTWFYEKRKKK